MPLPTFQNSERAKQQPKAWCGRNCHITKNKEMLYDFMYCKELSQWATHRYSSSPFPPPSSPHRVGFTHICHLQPLCGAFTLFTRSTYAPYPSCGHRDENYRLVRLLYRPESTSRLLRSASSLKRIDAAYTSTAIPYLSN